MVVAESAHLSDIILDVCISESKFHIDPARPLPEGRTQGAPRLQGSYISHYAYSEAVLSAMYCFSSSAHAESICDCGYENTKF